MPKFDITKERLESLRETMTNIEIARQEGVSVSAVTHRVEQLGIARRPVKEKGRRNSKRSSITKERLFELRQTMTNRAIAKQEGISLSGLKRLIKSFGLGSRQPAKEKKESERDKQNRADLEELRKVAGALGIRFDHIPVDTGLPLMERCKQILGRRMGEQRGRGYTLDGRPASTEQVVRAAGLRFGRQGKPEQSHVRKT